MVHRKIWGLWSYAKNEKNKNKQMKKREKEKAREQAKTF